MHNKKTIVAFITARGGSKGVPRKNIKLLGGIPMIAHVILSVQNSKCVDRIFVVTDDKEIADIAKKFGAEVIDEPEELARGNVTLEPVIKDALSVLEKEKKYVPDFISVIQPTSPLLSPETIRKCVEKVVDQGFDSCITAFLPGTYEWKWKPIYDASGEETSFEPEAPVTERVPRQNLPKIYHENGAFYITKTNLFKKLGHRWGGKMAITEMTEEDSLQVDTSSQFWLIEQVLKRRENESSN